VEKILAELCIAAKPTIRVFNKEDRVADKELLAALCRRFDAVAVSARNPATFGPLLDKLEWLLLNRGTANTAPAAEEPSGESQEAESSAAAQ